MRHTITHMSRFALSILKESHNGTIHSVYQKTVNLTICGQLLALQCASSPVSPVSLITCLDKNALEALALTPGLPVHIGARALTVGAHTFSYETAQILPLHIAAADRSLLPQLTARLEQALLAARTNGFDAILRADRNLPAPEYSLIHQTAERRMRDCTLAFARGELQAAAKNLALLIGLGTGLTPSGDDFLCGVLAGMTLCDADESAFSRALCEELPRHLADTNEISRTFLRCALDGQFSLPVCRLSRIPSAGEILDSFLAIGHSSGMDTLCGIFYFLKTAQDFPPNHGFCPN